MKKYLNKVIEFELLERDEDETVSGILIDYSQEWTLLKFNPIDFVLDGYMLLRNSNILDHRISKDSFTKRVLSKKYVASDTIPKMETASILSYFLNNNTIFSIELKNGNYKIGKIVTYDKERIVFKLLSTKAAWLDDIEIKIDEVVVIEFDTDYITSLELVID